MTVLSEFLSVNLKALAIIIMSVGFNQAISQVFSNNEFQITSDGVQDEEWEFSYRFGRNHLDTELTRMRSRGLEVVDLDIYRDYGGPRMASVCRANVGAIVKVESYLTQEGFLEKMDTYASEGLYLKDFEIIYLPSASNLYSGVWSNELKSQPNFREGLSAIQFKDHHTKMSKLGYELIDFEILDSYGLTYSGLWKEGSKKVNIIFDMSVLEFYRCIRKFNKKGYQMLDFEISKRGLDIFYTAAWIKESETIKSTLRTGQSKEDFFNSIRILRDSGYRLSDFETYVVDSDIKYCSYWLVDSERFEWNNKSSVTQLIEEYKNTNAVHGISVAIVHQGKLVYQGGQGMSDIKNGVKAHGRSVYTIASISKVIAGTMALKLEMDGALSDGTTVNLDLTDPTSNYLNIPGEGHTHIVEDLLSHNGCIWHYNGKTPSGHFDTAKEALEVMWHKPILKKCTVGVDNKYSTHAFTFVGAVLEAVTNRNVSRLVEEEISDRYAFPSLKSQFRYEQLRPNIERSISYKRLPDFGLVERDQDLYSKVRYKDNSWKVLGGGLESDAVDLAWFGWKVLNGDIVSSTALNSRLWKKRGGNYGLGWFVSSGRVQHGGQWDGGLTHINVYTSTNHQLVIVILSNTVGHELSELSVDIANDILN